MAKSVIYETKGRAREYNELAINLFTGCGHRCIYCYGADVMHQEKEQFEMHPKARVTPGDIARSAEEWAGRGETRRVLLCFVTDPYQPIENETMLTRKAINLLHDAGLNVILLTKGGRRSMRDFDLLTANDAYATTLTCLDPVESIKWEPNAALPSERLEALKEAHSRGIETWVSFEPVIHPLDTFRFLELSSGFVGHYKVGTMNYHPHGSTIDWRKYGQTMLSRLKAFGADYYFKKDLVARMGIKWSEFRQTHICN